MLELALQIFRSAAAKITQFKFALFIAGIVAMMAIAAEMLKGQFSSIGGVIIAVTMGVMLLFAGLMFFAAAKDKGGRYSTLFFISAWIFAALLMISAVFSLASVFFHWPLNLTTTNEVVPRYEGDYLVRETVITADLRQRRSSTGAATNVESKDPKMRVDRVVRQRTHAEPYQIPFGTNGSRVEQIESPTHPSMTTEVVKSSRFGSSIAHEYLAKIDSEKFPYQELQNVKTRMVYVNAFANEKEEWCGISPNNNTEVITMVILFPNDKPCKSALAHMKPINGTELAYDGPTKPEIYAEGRFLTWTILHPTKGVGYFVSWAW